MTSKTEFGLTATILFAVCLAIPSGASAQHRGSAAGLRGGASQMHATQVARVGGRRITFAPATNLSFRTYSNAFPYAGASTQMRLAAARRFQRGPRGFGYGSGFYLLDGGYYYLPADTDDSGAAPPEQAQQPQVIVLQQAPPAEAAEQPAAAPEESEPLPDVGQFTLVLRNGSQIQAVAFTRSNGNIVYITTEGGRRTIALADLDTDATTRINQERGTPIQL
jgi:hypothetical protein